MRVLTVAGSRWTVPLGGFLLALMGGVSYAWGSFVVPITQEFGWTTAQANLPFAVFMAVFALSMVPAGRLQDRFGPRRVALAGAGLFLVAYTLASLVRWIPHPAWLVLSYGGVGGMACGLTYACVAPPARKWFPDRPGFAISLAVAGFGLAAVLFSPLKVGVFIPAWGVAGTLFVLGLIVAAGSVVGALLVRNPPPDALLPRPAASGRRGGSQADVPPRELLRAPAFYVMWAAFAAVMVGGLMTIGLLTPYGKLVVKLPPAQAAFATSIFALCNGLGRPLAGFLGDRFGPVRVMVFTYAVQTLVFLGFPVVATGQALLYLCAALLGWGYAVTLALFPAVTAEAFGTKHLGMNYGLVFTAFGAGAVGPFLGSWLRDLTGSFTPAFLMAGAAAGVGLGLVAFLRFRLAFR